MASDQDLEARERLIQALLGGASVSDAARVSGFSRVWVQKLRKDPAFMAEVARRSAATGEIRREHQDVVQARAVLAEIMADEDEKASDRVSAAKALIQAHQTRVRAPAAQPPIQKPGAAAPLTAEEAARQLGLRVV